MTSIRFSARRFAAPAFLLAALAFARPADAAITIMAARITEGDLWVLGRSEEIDGAITLDDTFTEKSDSRGNFEFRVPYHPATCVVVVKTRLDSRAVVVANCGQRGPPGEAGPPGPAGAPGPPGPAATMPAVPSSSEVPASPAAEPVPATKPGGRDAAACGARAAQYLAESGSRVWIVRRGRMSQQNPLRPASGQPPAIVLQVTIDGRTASAYGANFDKMLQGGSPDELEQTSGNPIEWLRSVDPLPGTIQIVTEGGRSVFARLTFEQCGTPARAQSDPARGAARRRSETPPAEDPATPDRMRGLSLPRGAINELPPPR